MPRRPARSRAPLTLVAIAIAIALGLGAAGEGAAAAPPPAQAGPRTITVAATGDLLVHSPIFRRAQRNAGGRGYDFRPMFRHIRPLLRDADVALCHVETPLSPLAPRGYPAFRTPSALAPAIRWAGWDVCSTASNHTLDAGLTGVASTTRALSRAGVRHVGSAASARRRPAPVILTVKGVKVAFLAYTETTNGYRPPHRWSVNIARATRILDDARRARRAGAQVVVVNVHWGTEYRSATSAAQRRLARALMASRDVTAVVGQHVHVVQPITRVGGRIVVFGEGNLLSNQTPACCAPGSQDGIIALLRIEVAEGRAARVVGARYVPTWVRHPDFAVIPVGRGLNRRLAPAGALRASWRRTVAAVGRSRGIQPTPLRLP